MNATATDKMEMFATIILVTLYPDTSPVYLKMKPKVYVNAFNSRWALVVSIDTVGTKPKHRAASLKTENATSKIKTVQLETENTQLTDIYSELDASSMPVHMRATPDGGWANSLRRCLISCHLCQRSI